jgi:hypothetical protein
MTRLIHSAQHLLGVIDAAFSLNGIQGRLEGSNLSSLQDCKKGGGTYFGGM